MESSYLLTDNSAEDSPDPHYDPSHPNLTYSTSQLPETPVPFSSFQPRKRGRGRPRKNPVAPGTEPPLKKQRININGLYTHPELNRLRPSRRHTEGGYGNPHDTSSTSRARSHAGRTTSAAAMTAQQQQDLHQHHGEGYKPREERSWEDFYPDLDLDIELPAFNSEDVDAPKPSDEALSESPLSHSLPHSHSHSHSNSHSHPNSHSHSRSHTNGDLSTTPSRTTPLPGQYYVTPIKKRGPGRPPKKLESSFYSAGSPNRQIIAPVPLHNPKEKLVLPKPTYRRIDTFAAYEKAPGIGIHFVEKTFANVGYQESDIFVQPRTLIRGGKSSLEDENDLLGNDDSFDPHAKVRVEYDMDEQDERWLEVVNSERTSIGIDIIRPQYFEITMTLIEKEWHALERRIPKSNPKPPQTNRPRSSSAAAVYGETGPSGEDLDSKCTICDEGDCENTNAIVFCDGCDMAAHQECYGIPFIPEGQWLCRKCQLVGRSTSATSCIFCPNSEGAYKQTTNMKWSHLLCAIWVPEVSIGNQTFMEPIQDVDKVPKQRWKLNCFICAQRMGASIQCSNKNCYLAFHVTCGRLCQFEMRMKNPHGGLMDPNNLRAYCDKHVSDDWRHEHDTDRATMVAKDYYRRKFQNHQWGDSQQSALATEQIQESTEHDIDFTDDSNNSAAALKKKKALMKRIWRLPSGSPIVPQLVYNNVENTLAKYQLRKRKEFVGEACKYWTLKRESRRGASLLKRLQLQLEHFSSLEMTRRDFAAMGAKAGPKLQARIDFAGSLEEDVNHIAELCKKTHEREELKIKDMDLLRHLVDTVYFPIFPLLSPLLEKAQSLDMNHNYFQKGFTEIQNKLDQRSYISTILFARDIGYALNRGVFAASEEDEPPKPVSEILNAHQGPKHVDLQKDKITRAKRILKALTTGLIEASRKESDLVLGSPDNSENQIINILEHVLEAPLDMQPDRFLVNVDSSTNVSEGINFEVHDTDGDIEMRDSKSLTDTLHLADGASINETTKNDYNSRHARETSHIPALSTGSTTTNHTHEPLTPPRIDKDTSGHEHGGVPWYLSAFEPQGTTIHDPIEEDGGSGQEASKTNGHGNADATSDELSDMNEDEVNGLIGNIQIGYKKGSLKLAVPSATSEYGSAKKKIKARRRR